MPKLRFLSAEQFREAAKAGPVEDANLHRSFVADVKAADAGGRKLDFVISTDVVDRMGDTISVDGWQLANYRANPQVLWAHDSSLPPIARGVNVRVEDGKLKATAEFVPADNPAVGAFAEGIYQLYLGGFLRAVSVGFNPVKYAFSDEPGRSWGVDFLTQELLEFSACPIPANPEALMEARSMGIDITPIRDWAVKLLAGENLSLIDATRLAAITALPDEFRADAKKASGAKGASGLYRRCANRIERAIKGVEMEPEPASDPLETPAEPVVDDPEIIDQPTDDVKSGFADVAARRLITLRHKVAA
jgi:HK97 family phage prohead protease